MERLGCGGRIRLVAGDDPACLLVQPIDARDAAGFEQGAELIAARSREPFALAGLVIDDWNRDLSPWEAPPVFGREPFGDGAAETLAVIEDRLIPLALERSGLPADAPIILGGYSLAGLFALWAAYRTGRFEAVAAASPSVWFPGWIESVGDREPLAPCIYLSLGAAEERAGNPVTARVGECIRRQHALLEGSRATCTLEWNPGGHFNDPGARIAKGFAWCMEQACSPR